MLELRNISKSFPGVKALDQISVTFKPGEIHALMGENGAGKSTVMKIITGILQPDEGEIFLDGKPLRNRSFKDAVEHGINMVAQEIQVIPESTVAENIVLDRIEHFKKHGMIDWKRINQTARQYLDVVGLNISPEMRIGGLTTAQKQLIQIAKALSSKARYILMDEPTSSLTIHEANNLISIIRQLKKENVCVIFISHKIEEALSACDVISVLRDGKYMGRLECPCATRQDVVKRMIGREENTNHFGFLNIQDQPALEIKDFSCHDKFSDVSLRLNKGEILGFYGLVGSGRTELARLIIGVDKKDSGEVYVNGKRAEIRSFADSIYKYRIGYVTENRKEEGLILDASVADNISVTIWRKITNKLKSINLKMESAIVHSMIDKLKIKTPSKRTVVNSLSGGNQQKVSISKWLAADSDILIIDEPTVGVDIGAKEYIHHLIWNLAKEDGKSIILISSDMPELIALSRRILVFKDFKIIGEISGMNEKVISYDEISAEIGRYLA